MSLDHALRTITVTLSLDPAPPTRVGFSDILLLVDLADNALSDRVTTYNNYAEAAADSDLDATTIAALQVMFAQAPRISRIKVGTVDTGGGESWAQGYAACIVADAAVYGVCMMSRTAADVVGVAGAIESEGIRRLFAQSADSDWLTSGVPSAYSTIVAYERTALFFHDTATQYLAEGYAAAYLVTDPDEQSSPAGLRVRGVTAPATAITQAQAALAVANNINVPGSMSSAAPVFILDGSSITGRAIYVMTTADWLSVRFQEDIAALRLARSESRQKIPVTIEGQHLVLAVLRRRLAQGEDVGHLVDSSATGEPITDADRTAERLRMDVNAQTATDAIYFDTGLNLSRQPITAE